MFQPRQWNVPLQSEYPTAPDPYAVAVGDLNGDGKPDLVTANDISNNVLSSSTRVTGLPRARRLPDREDPDAVAIGDLNGTASLARCRERRRKHFLGVSEHRRRSFGTRQDHPIGLAPIGVDMGDVSGDGKPDVITADSGADTAPCSSTTAGRLLPRGVHHRPAPWSIGDLNGDGKRDLPPRTRASRCVLLNKGDGVRGDRRLRDRLRHAVRGRDGDVTGDGNPDLVTPNDESGTVSVLANAGGARSTRGAPTVLTSPVSLAIRTSTATGSRPGCSKRRREHRLGTSQHNRSLQRPERDS